MSAAPNALASPHLRPSSSLPSWAERLAYVPSPRSVVEHLDRREIGQHSAERKLALAVSNHFLGLAAGGDLGAVLYLAALAGLLCLYLIAAARDLLRGSRAS